MTEGFTTLTVEEIGRVRRLTLNRPDHHNPLTPRCIRELLQAVQDAEADAGVSVIVIRSTGRSFSSGYGFIAEDTDPGDFPRHASIEGDVSAMLDLADGWSRVWNCALPVIAQVQGNCLAGGTDLALHCDLVVAADDARIGFPPVRSMGVPPTNMWLYHLGPQWTKRLVLTGDTLSGVEAREVGLVVATAPAESLDDVVLGLAQRMALIGRDLLVANKRVVNMGVELMGRSQLQRFAALNDAIGHRAPEAKAFSDKIAEVGLRQAVRDRDAAFEAPPAPGGRSLDVSERRLGDAERTECPPEAEEGRQADGQVEDLGIRERAPQSIHELVVDAGVIHGEALGVLDREALLCAQHALVGRADGTVEVLAQPVGLDLVRPEGEADGALVELRDPHPRRLADAHREDALVVRRVDEARRRRAELGLERPDLHGVTTRAGGNFETGHGPTLCQYA